MRCRTLLLLFALTGQFLLAQSQYDDWKIGDYVVIHLKGGSTIKGEIIEIQSGSFKLTSDGLGEISIPIERILSIESIAPEEVENRLVNDVENNISYKNFISDTAIPLEEGTTIYSNILALGQGFTFGVTKNFSITSGLELFSPMFGESPVFFIQPKVSYSGPGKNVHFGIGTSLFVVPGSGSEVLGAIYGLTTIGNSSNNLTIGGGYIYAQGDDFGRTLFQLSGSARIGDKHILRTDHFLLELDYDTEVIGTWSIRFLQNERFNIELGIAVAYSEGVLPIAGATYVISR